MRAAYAIVSDTLASKLGRCDVVQDAVAWELSDHSQSVLEFDEHPVRAGQCGRHAG